MRNGLTIYAPGTLRDHPASIAAKTGERTATHRLDLERLAETTGHRSWIPRLFRERLLWTHWLVKLSTSHTIKFPQIDLGPLHGWAWRPSRSPKERPLLRRRHHSVRVGCWKGHVHVVGGYAQLAQACCAVGSWDVGQDHLKASAHVVKIQCQGFVRIGQSSRRLPLLHDSFPSSRPSVEQWLPVLAAGTEPLNAVGLLLHLMM